MFLCTKMCSFNNRPTNNNIKDENSLHLCKCDLVDFYWYNETDLTNASYFVIYPTALFSQQPLSTLPLDRSLFVIYIDCQTSLSTLESTLWCSWDWMWSCLLNGRGINWASPAPPPRSLRSLHSVWLTDRHPLIPGRIKDSLCLKLLGLNPYYVKY